MPVPDTRANGADAPDSLARGRVAARALARSAPGRSVAERFLDALVFGDGRPGDPPDEAVERAREAACW